MILSAVQRVRAKIPVRVAFWSDEGGQEDYPELQNFRSTRLRPPSIVWQTCTKKDHPYRFLSTQLALQIFSATIGSSSLQQFQNPRSRPGASPLAHFAGCGIDDTLRALAGNHNSQAKSWLPDDWL